MKIRRETSAACLFVCTRGSKKKSGTCKGRGANGIAKALKKELEKRGLEKRVRVRKTGCLGHCSRGPIILSYPDREILMGVGKKEAADVVDRLQSSITFANRRAPGYRSVGG